MAEMAAARTLRRLQERRGWSWTDLARALASAARDLGVTRVAAASQASIRRTVARWERPDHPMAPDERYQVLLAYLYATRDGVPSTGPGSDLEALLGALAEHGIPPARIQELRRDTRAAAGDGAPSARPPCLTPDLLEKLRTELAYLQRQVGTVPFVRVQIALTPATTTCRRLLATAPAGPLRTGLCETAADTLGFAARYAFETRDDSTAHTSGTQAVEW